MEHLLGLTDILKSEKITAIASQSRLKGIYDNLPRIIDVQFKLPYFVGKLEDAESIWGEFQSYCYIHYVQTPYTCWIIYSLYQKGYYLESVILYRHLLETFIQMRYFQKYTDKLNDHIKGEKRVQFKHMFEEFSKGYYGKYYGVLLSGAAHGVLMKSLFRFIKPPKNQPDTIMGCQYIEAHATYVINQLIPLILGFFNFYSGFFPNNAIFTDTSFNKSVNESMEWLKKAIDSHKKTYPDSNEWISHIENFIYS